MIKIAINVLFGRSVDLKGTIKYQMSAKCFMFVVYQKEVKRNLRLFSVLQCSVDSNVK